MSRYTEQERREAVRQYLLLGSFEKAGVVSGVPKDTIYSWYSLQEGWWAVTVQSLVEEMERQYVSGWRRVLGKAVEVIEDRLENGDAKVVAGGEVKRVPVPAKEAAVIAGIASDKLGLRAVGGPPVAEAGDERRARLRAIAEADRASRLTQ